MLGKSEFFLFVFHSNKKIVLTKEVNNTGINQLNSRHFDHDQARAL